jgi:hypothetical protein
LSPVFVFAEDDSLGRLRLEYWAYEVSGNAVIKGSSADLDGTSKLINGNNYGFVLGGERRFDNWGLMMDLFGGKFSKSQQIPSGETVEWTSESAILLAGLRGYSNNYKIQFSPYNPADDKDRSDYVNWADPYLGLRLKSALNSKLAVELYGDAGGFGVGFASELSVLAHAALVWSVTPGINIVGGYKLFDLDSPDDNDDRPTQICRCVGSPLGLKESSSGDNS